MDLMEQFEDGGGNGSLADVRDAVRRVGEQVEGLARDLAAQSSQLGVRLDALETAVGQVVGSEALGLPVQRPEAGGKHVEAVEHRVAALADDIGEMLGRVESRLRQLDRTVDEGISALGRELAERSGAPPASLPREDETAVLLQEALGGLSRRKRQRVLDGFRAAAERRRGAAARAAEPAAAARSASAPPVPPSEPFLERVSEAEPAASSEAAAAARALGGEVEVPAAPTRPAKAKPARAAKPKAPKKAAPRRKPAPRKKAAAAQEVTPPPAMGVSEELGPAPDLPSMGVTAGVPDSEAGEPGTLAAAQDVPAPAPPKARKPRKPRAPRPKPAAPEATPEAFGAAAPEPESPEGSAEGGPPPGDGPRFP